MIIVRVLPVRILIKLFNNNIYFSFQRRENNTLTGLLLQKGGVSGVAVKKLWVRRCFVSQNYFVSSFGMKALAI